MRLLPNMFHEFYFYNVGIENVLSCSSWPIPSIVYDCTAGPWKFLDVSMDISQTENCEILCQRQKESGCCFLGEDAGCHYRIGADAISNRTVKKHEYQETRTVVACSLTGISH